MKTSLVAMLATVALGYGIGHAAVAVVHDAHTGPGEMALASSADGGGALVAAWDFTAPLAVTFDVAVGGLARYSGTDPFFVALEADEPEDALFRLEDGTPVTMEIVAIDPTVGVRVNGVSLLQAGDAVLVGTMPDLHADPEWQLTLPENVAGCGQVRFRLTTTASAYVASDVYTATLATDVEAPCAAAPTPTATADPTPAPTPAGGACGDADGNGSVSVTDGVSILRGAAGLAGCTALPRCDVDGSGSMTVTDGVNVLRAAAGLPATMTCPDL